jgi:hypothetical protein
VDFLIGNKTSLERIGLKPLSVSIFSLALMLSIAFLQPNRISANYDLTTTGICSVEEDCQTTDCAGQETGDLHNFTSAVPASLLR